MSIQVLALLVLVNIQIVICVTPQHARAVQLATSYKTTHATSAAHDSPVVYSAHQQYVHHALQDTSTKTTHVSHVLLDFQVV